MRKWIPAITAIVIGLALAILGTTPQPPRSSDSDAATFSGKRAMEHVRIIAAEPHPTGSEANARVRDYLKSELEKIGAGVLLPQGAVDDRSLDRFGRWSGERPDALTLTNVIGIIPGKVRSRRAVALMAHHDTVYGSPGAPDDTAGVASILETVRAVTSQGPTERDIIVVLTDGEELGLLGARQFVRKNRLADRVGAIINLEARGGGGRTTLFQTSKDNGEAIKLYADSVSRPGGSSLATFIYEILPNDTDLTPALERDYVAYNLSFIGRPGLYHSPKATPDNLDQGSLQDMGDQTLALTLALANAEELPEQAPDRTFFDFFGLFLISYGTVAGWVLLVATATVHFFCWSGDPKGSWAKGLLASASVIIGGGLLLYGLNMLSGSGLGEGIYYDRLAAIPLLEVQAAFACLAILAASAPLWGGRSASLVGLLVALALQISAPTTAFLVVWPLLLGGLSALALRKLNGPVGTAFAVVLGGMVLGMLLQFSHQFMQGVGPDLPSVVAFLAALAFPVLGALFPALHRKRAWQFAAVCLVGALAMAMYIRFDPVADTVPVYDSMKG